jgi:hypothetical protein
MTLAVCLSVELKIPIGQIPITVVAAEAARIMVLHQCLILEVLAFDALTTGTTKASIEFVVVVVAIGFVVKHIEY